MHMDAPGHLELMLLDLASCCQTHARLRYFTLGGRGSQQCVAVGHVPLELLVGFSLQQPWVRSMTATDQMNVGSGES